MAQLLKCAGLPDGVCNIIQGEAETGKALCESKRIHKISFTGGFKTGANIAQMCSKPGNLKPITLELGGKGALILFEDCSVDMAVNGALMANFYSQGFLFGTLFIKYFRSSLYKCFKSFGSPLNFKRIYLQIIIKDKGFINWSNFN